MEKERRQTREMFQQISDLTLPECRSTCKIPYSCCSPEYCLMAIDYAKDKWKVILTPTKHPKLPLMGKNGCIAEPYLRPLCSIHTCEINSIGIKKNDPEWTKKYFELREKLQWRI